MSKELLEIHNLHAGVEGKEILKGIDLTIGRGEVHAVMGPNGAGKSTFSIMFASYLQYKLGLTGAKHMCDRGACGSCTVIQNGRPVLSCQMLAAECEGTSIQTIEGIAADPKWKPLIDAYCKWDAMQCGYCTPGFLVTAKCLLDRNPDPSETDIKKALAGNICICGTYPRHSQAILEAAAIIAKGAN